MWLLQIIWNSGVLDPKLSLHYLTLRFCQASGFLQLDVMKLARADTFGASPLEHFINMCPSRPGQPSMTQGLG